MSNTPSPYQRANWYRASGDCVCEECGKQYYEHPLDQKELSYDNSPFMHILCNGDLVKL